MQFMVVGSNAPALVDDCWASLSRFRWRLDKDGYVYRKTAGKRVYLHHLVLPGQRYPQFLRDHENRDKMDNRADNLRWLTAAESAQNKSAYPKNATGRRGVTLNGKGFLAIARLNGKPHRLGTYPTIEEADRVVSQWRAQHMPFAA